jgi:hypothetical protein
MDTKRRPFCRFWIGPTVVNFKTKKLRRYCDAILPDLPIQILVRFAYRCSLRIAVPHLQGVLGEL